jgi:hypothetical protein
VADLAIRPATRILHGDLRLRAAYGESTQRLATFQAFPDLSQYYGNPYYPYPGGFGPAPKPIGPETMREAEGGVDVGWGSRGAISLTAYRRALRNVLPQTGLSAIYFQVAQPIEMSSSGVEADARATLVERGAMRWSMRAIVATNRNRITTQNLTQYSFDDGMETDQPVGVGIRRPYTFNDANGDGVAEFVEVGGGQATVDTLHGSTPTLAVALHSELALGRRLTIGVIVDRRSGAWTRSSVARLRCAGPEYACREMQDPATPLAAQATALEDLYLQRGLGDTFDASFTRLREVSLRWTLPTGRLGVLGAPGAHVLVAGRDLATWTKWPGTDPEVSSLLRSALTRDDGSAVPLPRRLIVGLEFDY